MEKDLKKRKYEGLTKNLQSWCLVSSGLKSLKPIQLRPNSIALVVLYDELLARRRKDGHAKFNYIYVWKTKGGEILDIKDIETKHLYNIIQYIEGKREKFK